MPDDRTLAVGPAFDATELGFDHQMLQEAQRNLLALQGTLSLM